jgi:hypothetical protein
MCLSIIWKLIANPLGYTEYTLGTTAPKDSFFENYFWIGLSMKAGECLLLRLRTSISVTLMSVTNNRWPWTTYLCDTITYSQGVNSPFSSAGVCSRFMRVYCYMTGSGSVAMFWTDIRVYIYCWRLRIQL